MVAGPRQHAKPDGRVAADDGDADLLGGVRSGENGPAAVVGEFEEERAGGKGVGDRRLGASGGLEDGARRERAGSAGVGASLLVEVGGGGVGRHRRRGRVGTVYEAVYLWMTERERDESRQKEGRRTVDGE